MDDYADQQSIDSTPKRISASEKVGDRVDIVKVRNPLQAGDLEIAIQWYKPELSSNLDDDSVFLLLAMNNKTIAGNSSSNSFSQVSSLFHIVFRLEDCIAIHDELVDLIQNSEGDHAIKAGLFVFQFSRLRGNSSRSESFSAHSKEELFKTFLGEGASSRPIKILFGL